MGQTLLWGSAAAVPEDGMSRRVKTTSSVHRLEIRLDCWGKFSRETLQPVNRPVVVFTRIQ